MNENEARAAIRPPPTGDPMVPAFERPFAVDHVLASELPASLGTVDAPERYTVTAVFTRRPHAGELELLQDPAVNRQLAAAGYPDVTLSASDRRLLIGNSNLHELEAGLARAIAMILGDIGEQVQARHDDLASEFEVLSDREAARAASVAIAAGRIRFEAHASMYH
ncbi:hypothetical protein [Agromyces bauzanensis]